MKVLRKIVEKKIDRIRSLQIRKTCGIQPINELSQVEKMQEGRMPKYLPHGFIEGLRVKRIPRKKWFEDVEQGRMGMRLKTESTGNTCEKKNWSRSKLTKIFEASKEG